MAATLCSDWATMEGLIHAQQPFGLEDFSSFPLDGSGTTLSVLDHLPFSGEQNLLEHLLADDPIDVDLFSYLFSSSSRGGATAYDQMDLHGTPPGLHCTLGATAYLEPGLALSSPLENMAAMRSQGPVTAAATVGFSSAGGCEKTVANGCPSAQSVAARHRRKRISEKTQELGQLIPGGCRMNTAEMLQSAFKYVKFLQAQIGMLDVMAGSFHEEAEGIRLMQVLLASPATQGKLASEERCVVPTWVVRALMEDHEIKDHPSISGELNEFMGLM